MRFYFLKLLPVPLIKNDRMSLVFKQNEYKAPSKKNELASHHHYTDKSLEWLAVASIINCLHSLLSCVILYACNMLKFVSSFMLSLYLVFGLPLLRFPNTIPVIKSFPKQSRRTTCPKNASCLLSMQFSSRSVVLVFSCSKMLSSVRYSVHLTRNSLR